jgi:hypothetical protein
MITSNLKRGDIMKNIILIILLIVMLGASFVFEPVTDSVDIIAGSTNPTYSTTIDLIAGVSEEGNSNSAYGD